MSEQLNSTSANASVTSANDTTTNSAATPKPISSTTSFLTLTRMSHSTAGEAGLVILRVISLCLLLHGFHKLHGFAAFRDGLSEVAVGSIAPTLIGSLVVFLQIVLPVLLFIGLFTRWSGLILAVMFAFIILAVNVPSAGWIGQQGGLSFEAALLYFTIGIVLLFTGPGRYSVDRVLTERG